MGTSVVFASSPERVLPVCEVQMLGYLLAVTSPCCQPCLKVIKLVRLAIIKNES